MFEVVGLKLSLVADLNIGACRSSFCANCCCASKYVNPAVSNGPFLRTSYWLSHQTAM